MDRCSITRDMSSPQNWRLHSHDLESGPRWHGLTSCCLPQRVEVSHEDGVVHLSEEPLQDVCHVLDEVVSDPKFDVSSIFAKLFHQDSDPGFGTVLPVDPLVAQTCGACSERHSSTQWERRNIYWMQLHHPHWIYCSPHCVPPHPHRTEWWRRCSCPQWWGCRFYSAAALSECFLSRLLLAGCQSTTERNLCVRCPAGG